MEEEKISVLIADDTEVARQGLWRLLGGLSDISIVGEATTIYSVLSLTQQLHPDILLLDLKWYGDESGGTSAIEYLRQSVPDTKIIAMTVYDHLISRAREVGAHLAITKDFSRDQLIQHIRGLHYSKVLPPAKPINIFNESLIENLTEREVDVLELLAEGFSDRQIADELVISVNTAKNHVANILSKLGVENRTQAVILAIRKGLLSNHMTKR